jgi:ATP-binding cassette subfamily F protein uup
MARTGEVILNAAELNFHIGTQTILDKANLTIFQGERIGLVGRNGAGKSTLLSILSGLFGPDSGTLAVRRGTRISFLPQNPGFEPGCTVRDHLLGGAASLLAMIERYEAMSHDDPEAVKLEHRIGEEGGWDLERRADEVATRLRLPDAERTLSSLSGGELRRIALGRALMCPSDLLILDEPTNHLDTDAIEWLEQTLERFSGACILVTHDRYFLDRVVERILELSDGVLFSHPGNYTAYLTAKAARDERAETMEAKRQAFLRRELEWVRRGPKARTTKGKARLDRFHAASSEAPPPDEFDVDLIFPVPPKLGTRVVELRELSLSLGGKPLFNNLSFDFSAGDRIGVIGPNGAGKTSLVKSIIGRIRPDSGTVLVGDQTQFNYVDQHRVRLDDEKTVFEEIGEGRDFVSLGGEGGMRVSIWTYLKRYLFTDDRIRTRIRFLSGGERSRLMLAKIAKDGGNFLIFDEPTNDLDLPTLRVLEEAILRFEGTVLAISHDRYFLNRICTGILAFEDDSKVRYQIGDYDDYLRKRGERIAALQVVPQPQPPPVQTRKPGDSANRKKLSFHERRELEGIEDRIVEAESEVAAIETRFADPGFYAANASNVGEILADLERRKKEVESLYHRWQELNDREA